MFITTKIASNSFLKLQYMIYKYLESFIHNPYLVELPEKKTQTWTKFAAVTSQLSAISQIKFVTRLVYSIC